MTSVPLRNVDLDPETPVEAWPFEVVQTLIERGGLADWRLLIKEIQRSPWGATSQRVEEVLSISRPYGTADLFEKAIADARNTAIAAEKAEVAREVGELVARSRLSKGEFASRIGTSPSRLSTYVSGQVMPSAALMVRMRHVADAARH